MFTQFSEFYGDGDPKENLIACVKLEQLAMNTPDILLDIIDCVSWNDLKYFTVSLQNISVKTNLI